jgi:hypothetical protein
MNSGSRNGVGSKRKFPQVQLILKDKSKNIEDRRERF